MKNLEFNSRQEAFDFFRGKLAQGIYKMTQDELASAISHSKKFT